MLSEAFDQDYLDCPVVCALNAPCFTVIPMLWIRCLPLHLQVKGYTCGGVLELVPHCLIIISKTSTRV